MQIHDLPKEAPDLAEGEPVTLTLIKSIPVELLTKVLVGLPMLPADQGIGYAGFQFFCFGFVDFALN